MLEERDFPVAQLHALASKRSVGRRGKLRGRRLPDPGTARASTSRSATSRCFPPARRCRASTRRSALRGRRLVIDNTSEFRYREDVPLVVPEVNPQALDGIGTSGIIANPNCSTIQLVVALKTALRRGRDRAHRRGDLPVRLRRRARSARGTGRASRSRRSSGKGPIESAGGAKQIAFNCVPHIDDFQDNGYTREEMKIVWETARSSADSNYARECHRGARAGVLRAFRGWCTSRPGGP